MNIKTILQLHIYLWFPACKPFYIIFLFKLLWEKLHQISQTLNNVWINGWNITLKMEKLLHRLAGFTGYDVRTLQTLIFSGYMVSLLFEFSSIVKGRKKFQSVKYGLVPWQNQYVTSWESFQISSKKKLWC